ncbi:hypothetical protein BpHYR1_028007 [Brachionus plicatilis]|uniref:Uncharacterized protein n=1 Tax=Brachionus plicatilis TaxID=10195 RepID=A0A3M7RKY3_BRAPC|nr:hypothetical protein BpHYR1_028007 [Brachionus plicatilis]
MKRNQKLHGFGNSKSIFFIILTTLSFMNSQNIRDSANRGIEVNRVLLDSSEEYQSNCSGKS